MRSRRAQPEEERDVELSRAAVLPLALPLEMEELAREPQCRRGGPCLLARDCPSPYQRGEGDLEKVLRALGELLQQASAEEDDDDVWAFEDAGTWETVLYPPMVVEDREEISGPVINLGVQIS